MKKTIVMTREQILEEIKKIEFRISIAKHADYLDSDDWKWIHERESEIEKLKKMMTD